MVAGGRIVGADGKIDYSQRACIIPAAAPDFESASTNDPEDNEGSEAPHIYSFVGFAVRRRSRPVLPRNVGGIPRRPLFGSQRRPRVSRVAIAGGSV
jgi:hypothetical protein